MSLLLPFMCSPGHVTLRAPFALLRATFPPRWMGEDNSSRQQPSFMIYGADAPRSSSSSSPVCRRLDENTLQSKSWKKMSCLTAIQEDSLTPRVN